MSQADVRGCGCGLAHHQVYELSRGQDLLGFGVFDLDTEVLLYSHDDFDAIQSHTWSCGFPVVPGQEKEVRSRKPFETVTKIFRRRVTQLKLGDNEIHMVAFHAIG